MGHFHRIAIDVVIGGVTGPLSDPDGAVTIWIRSSHAVLGYAYKAAPILGVGLLDNHASIINEGRIPDRYNPDVSGGIGCVDVGPAALHRDRLCHSRDKVRDEHRTAVD